MKRLIVACPALACLAFASVIMPGCSASHASVLGVAPDPNAATTDVAKLKKADTVTVRGTMVEKCPVAGCWFKLQDKSGIVKVDTKDSGFVVTDVPLNSKVTVSGVVKEDGERTVQATGISY
jgi:uncharacterized protein YdeI (BOF family)